MDLEVSLPSTTAQCFYFSLSGFRILCILRSDDRMHCLHNPFFNLSQNPVIHMLFNGDVIYGTSIWCLFKIKNKIFDTLSQSSGMESNLFPWFFFNL